MVTQINKERKFVHRKNEVQSSPEIIVENGMIYKEPGDILTSHDWNHMVSAVSGLTTIVRGEKITPKSSPRDEFYKKYLKSKARKKYEDRRRKRLKLPL